MQGTAARRLPSNTTVSTYLQRTPWWAMAWRRLRDSSVQWKRTLLTRASAPTSAKRLLPSRRLALVWKSSSAQILTRTSSGSLSMDILTWCNVCDVVQVDWGAGGMRVRDFGSESEGQ